jgi:hypothetical protein
MYFPALEGIALPSWGVSLELLRGVVSKVPGNGYFPMQNVEKMRFKMSSAVVAPVIASMGRRAA